MPKNKRTLPRNPRSRGIALIIVLGALVLVTILVLAFLTGVGSELQSSKMYANGSSVKLLAQSAVSLVVGEIQTATSNQALDWASEPGMIRTYDNTGTATAYYKLYSDSNIIGTGAFDHTQVNNLIPDGTGTATVWYNQPGVYVDLNQPIYFNGTNYYPILDGNSADYVTSYTSTLSTKTLPVASSTISSLAPTGTNGLPAVNGYWLNSKTPRNSASPDYAPMPVKWLYVLQNGEVIIPDSNPTNNIVTFSGNAGQPQPSASDPIVGRIAYWTDDESCKVNINTASEGTFWDTPRTFTPQDFAYALYQPAQNEFQRYPGHPATVSLSTVFNGFTTEPATSYPEDLYPITPRVQAGGSKEGTVSTYAITGSLSLRSSRLYSSSDEFLFQPTLGGTPGTGTRTLNDALLNATTELNQTAVNQAGFFITACSNAPDVNVFNQPRISMWPITLTGSSAASAAPAETAFDKLIAFCSTLNNKAYYFTRWDPTSSTNDLPATGSASNSSLLARNRDLIEYLRTLTSAPAPGFGGTLRGSSGKYLSNGDGDQILTEMFDYIRCTNLQDTSTGATSYTGSLSTSGPYEGGGIGQVVPIQDTTVSITDTFTDSVQGNMSNNPRGFGRYPTIQQAALVFIGAGDNATQGTGTYTLSPTATTTISGTLTATTDPNPPTSYTPQVQAGLQRVQAGFFIQMFDPSEGVPITRPWYQIQVSGLSNLQWNGQSIFPTSATFPFVYNTSGITVQPTAWDMSGQNLLGSSGGNANGFVGWSYGGMEDFRQFSQSRDSNTGGNATTVGHWKLPIYPFISPPTGQSGTAPDMTNGGTFTFSSSGNVTVSILSLNSSGVATGTVQTVYLKFPGTTFPVPTSIDNNPPYLPTGTLTNPAFSNLPTSITGTTSFTAASMQNYDFLSFLDSYTATANTMGSGWGRLGFPAYNPWLSKLDVVRAIVASDPSVSKTAASPGDPRLIAARQNVPNVFYQPITGSGYPTAADYFGGTASAFSHMLRFLTTMTFYGGIGGKLAGGAGAYDDYQTQYFQNVGNDIGDTLYSFSGGSGVRPKDTIVASQTGSITLANQTGALAPPGDWDNGIENSSDGAYINKADEGDAGSFTVGTGSYTTNGDPYFELDYGNSLPGPTFFTPNRMIPSPGMFGSLPTGVWSGKAWQTLLFRPGPANHPGLGTPAVGPPYTSPPDHLYLDFFNMPVVEPYAISTPLATSGRINMNYLIIPFTYINRDTGLRAAMKNQMVESIPASQISKYKTHTNPNSNPSSTITTRYSINLDATLSQFLARFYNSPTTSQGADGVPDIFHSASEICDIDLVPSDTTAGTTSDLALPITRSNMDKYWGVNSLTGDNSRERPYANLYPLLTTKSNTFTVHYRVQTLKQGLAPSAASSAWAQWREGTDLVTSESRGSETIERYIDPNNSSIPDYAASPNATAATPLSNFYKFRVVSTKQFPP